MLSLPQLKAFTMVCHCGSFTKAADLLGQTPSYVSRKITALEADLGVTLFHRTTRQLQITPEGEIALEKATHLLSLSEEIENLKAENQESELQGHLKIDASAPFIQHVVIPHLAEFHHKYPKLALELCSFNRVVDLVENRIDVAFRIGELRDSSLYYRTLGQSKLWILASPQYLKQHGEPSCVTDLAQHALLGFSQPKHLNTWPLVPKESVSQESPIEHDNGATNPTLGGKRAGYDAQVAISAESGESLRSLALNHAGIVCLADFMTRDDVNKGRLKVILANSTYPKCQPIHAVYARPLCKVKKVEAFVNFIAKKITS